MTIFCLISGCHLGWSYLKHTGKCYKHDPTKRDWTAALESCRSSSPSSTLASVHDNTTNEFLTSLSGGNEYTWLGGYQENGTEDGAPWSWSDGSVWEFENWRNGEPNNVGGYQDYLGIWAEKWNDWPLDGHLDSQIPILGFLCQKKGQ